MITATGDSTTSVAAGQGSDGAGVVCPVCGNGRLETMAARIAPFMAARTQLPADTAVQSRYCQACDHAFFTPFLSSDQLARVYTGYRDAAYNEQRLRFEPDYTKYIEDFGNLNSAFSSHRNQFYDLFFAGDAADRGIVVDFGGGDGAFSRRAFPNAEISVVEHDFAGDRNALLARADVLFCAHVFEHIPQPFALLQSLAAPMRSGSRLYIEVPIDYSGGLGACYAEIQNGLARGAPMPWHSLSTLHEHLNHFSKRSVGTLMRRAGFDPLEFYLSNLGLLGVLARKREPSP